MLAMFQAKARYNNTTITSTSHIEQGQSAVGMVIVIVQVWADGLTVIVQVGTDGLTVKLQTVRGTQACD